jgi:anaerobic magnesium-protoporphyrin IX monomethyl ester cyclase
MTTILLIYPFFQPRRDRSVFRFPPLGIGYLAAALQQEGHQVHLIDCTFRKRQDALQEALAVGAEVVGLYCMVTMVEECMWFAEQLRPTARLLVAGGPLPTCDPLPFLKHFDVVVRGEGERTVCELLRAWSKGGDPAQVPGIVMRPREASGTEAGSTAIFADDRPFEADLDALPQPARSLFPNADYIRHGMKKYGYSISTVMSTRGCPFRCEFCSNVVFGGSYRERSPENVVDEVEQVLRLGYQRVSFGDDVFTLRKERVLRVCAEIRRRHLDFHWECLGRVDSLDEPTAREMRNAGCTRIYFGIESGNQPILDQMNKRTTPEQARQAVEAAHRAGLEVGAFFILGYPGDTDDTVLATLRYAGSLPLDYLGLTMPYPLPGTALYDRVRNRVTRAWRPDESLLVSHVLIFDADFSERKMWFGILKGQAEFQIRRRTGRLAPALLGIFGPVTDAVFRRMR